MKNLVQKQTIYLFTVNAEDQIFPQKLYFLQMLYILWKKAYMTEII